MLKHQSLKDKTGNYVYYAFAHTLISFVVVIIDNKFT